MSGKFFSLRDDLSPSLMCGRVSILPDSLQQHCGTLRISAAAVCLAGHQRRSITQIAVWRHRQWPTLLEYDNDISNLKINNRSESSQLEQMSVDKPTCSVINHPIYHRCKLARQSDYKDKLVSVSVDDSFGRKIFSQSFSDHLDIEKTFHGSRILVGNVPVKQLINLSLDPTSLVCVSRKKEHKILNKPPIKIFFSDQNFVSSISGNNNECLCIVQMEDAWLSDLWAFLRKSWEIISFLRGAFSCLGQLQSYRS
jgi:hypothetical protein